LPQPKTPAETLRRKDQFIPAFLCVSASLREIIFLRFRNLVGKVKNAMKSARSRISGGRFPGLRRTSDASLMV
jgi:hypothetical protein